MSSEACRELGFSSNLLCSSCNLLGQFNLNQLDPFCRQCCQEEAQLEVRNVGFGPSPLCNNLIHYIMLIKLFTFTIYENLDCDLKRKMPCFMIVQYRYGFADMPYCSRITSLYEQRNLWFCDSPSLVRSD